MAFLLLHNYTDFIKIMTEFSDLNLCPINNRQGIVIDGEGSKVICKD